MRAIFVTLAMLLGFGTFVSFTPTQVAMAQQASVVYEGDWNTTNRKLDGTMKCDVVDLGGGRWKGKFWGEWQGVRFSYNVEWSGPPNNLRGTARIDGADYQWTGSITANRFQGVFDGSRYRGSFDLKR